MDGVYQMNFGDLAYVIIRDGETVTQLYDPSVREVRRVLEEFSDISSDELIKFILDREPHIYGIIFDIGKIREAHRS